MPTQIFVNGSMVERDSARVSAYDAGLLHGVGLFETMLGGARAGAEGEEPSGWAFDLEAHLARLAASARELGLSESLRTEPLGAAVRLTVSRSGYERARVRLTVTGGDLNMLSGSGQGPADPTIVIDVQPATRYPDELMDRGVSAVIADARANPLNPFEGHKTLNYWWRLRALQDAATHGAGETVVLQVTNHVCSGAVSNLFARHGDVLMTPIARGEEGKSDAETTPGEDAAPSEQSPAQGGGRGVALPSPVLPGTTRNLVFRYAAELGLDVQRRMMSVDDLLDADEVFATNSSWGALPIVRIESASIGAGARGETAREVRARWLRDVEMAAAGVE